jgi:hypothetical protein
MSVKDRDRLVRWGGKKGEKLVTKDKKAENIFLPRRKCNDVNSSKMLNTKC